MYDETILTHDAATATFHDDAEGITVDEEEGDVSIDWDSVERVTVDNPPHAEAFDTKEFYKLPATVARPIPQPYQFRDEVVWLKKPREELKRAAWSLDNAPWTLGHPETGMVKNVDDIHGFWGDPRYIDSIDDLDADLHVPVGDEEAKSFIEGNTDVSVGFHNRIERVDQYDGIVGGEDDEDADLDGYQTEMFFDHCASVKLGRCPSEKGCGIDSANHGHMDAVPSNTDGPFKYPLRITNKSDGGGGTVSMQSTTDQPEGIYVADDTWFAVGPDEHTKERTDYPEDAMFPVDNCSNIEDAWNLRGHSDNLKIEESTLESRIKRAGEAKGCDSMPWETEDSLTTDDIAKAADRYSIGGRCADCGDNENDTTMEINFDDLSTEVAIEKLVSQHDGASDRIEELREAEDTASTVEEVLDGIEDVEGVEELADEFGSLRDERDELRERVDELERPQMEEHAEYIADKTDRFGEDAEEVIEHFDEDLDTLAEKRDEIEELAKAYDEQTANPSSGSKTDGVQTTGKYAKTPW